MRYLVVLLLIGAGCLQSPSEDLDNNGMDESGVTWESFSATSCKTVTTFMLVEQDIPARHLPPGFLARGLDDFEPFTPVMFGKIPAYLATVECASSTPHNETTEVTFMGFRVVAPDFTQAGLHPRLNQPATYDFYTNQFWAGTPAQQAYMETIGWESELVDQSVRLEASDSPLDGSDSPLRNVAQGTQTVSDWFAAETLAGYVDENIQRDAIIRFWHRFPDGLRFMEFQLQDDMEPTAGTVACTTFAAGSPIDELTGRSAEGREGHAACTQYETFTLVFPEHDLEGGFLSLPGVFKP